MTFLEAVNDVLTRLREDTVSAVNETEYSNLVGKFINTAKREIEDSWLWEELRNTIRVETTANDFSYTLSSVGQRFSMLNAFNDTQNFEMKLAPSNWLTKLFLMPNPATGAPIYFDINGYYHGDPIVNVWPIPDGTYYLNFDIIIPQEDFVPGVDDAVEIDVPYYPVILGAYARAISERGEDGGALYDETMADFKKALADAIGFQAAHKPHEFVWRVE